MMYKGYSKIICIIIIFVYVLSSACTLSAAESDDGDVIFYSGKKNDMVIALTFDDGPHPSQTLKILDILDKYGIKATFFAIGVNAEYYSESIKEAVARGHEIGNHTYSHPKLDKLDSNALKQEILRSEKSIYDVCGYKTDLMRPPEGLVGTDLKEIARDLGYKVILWDIDTRDWAHTSPYEISRNVLKNVSSGDIILMHDYIGKNSPTAEAIELFIPKLLDMGYRFVTVSELIS